MLATYLRNVVTNGKRGIFSVLPLMTIILQLILNNKISSHQPVPAWKYSKEDKPEGRTSYIKVAEHSFQEPISNSP